MQLPSTQNVKVKMGDGLATFPSNIRGYSVSVGNALVRRDSPSHVEALREKVGIFEAEFVSGREMLSGEHKYMYGSLRELVFDCDYIIARLDNFSGLVPSNYPAEDAVFRHQFP